MTLFLGYCEDISLKNLFSINKFRLLRIELKADSLEPMLKDEEGMAYDSFDPI